MGVNTGKLFGQNPGHSNRNYSDPDKWGKNQFNTSFPVSLIAYMESKGIQPVYLKLTKERGKKLVVKHDSITTTELYGIPYSDDSIFYNFEASFKSYKALYTAKAKSAKGDMKDKEVNLDLVIQKITNRTIVRGKEKLEVEDLRGFEVKLTTLPDSTTQYEDDECRYGCEIVVRPPTILALACSICQRYDTKRKRDNLHTIITDGLESDVVSDAKSLATDVSDEVYQRILSNIMKVCMANIDNQVPLLIQTVWKTNNNNTELADDCLDVFVWSNLALIQLFSSDKTNGISRKNRSIIWLFVMLLYYSNSKVGKFDYYNIRSTFKSGDGANDKAFSVGGKTTNALMACEYLTHPRIKKSEINKIIQGNGQKNLKPERRLDAFICNFEDELFSNS